MAHGAEAAKRVHAAELAYAYAAERIDKAVAAYLDAVRHQTALPGELERRPTRSSPRSTSS